jgi:hypothetical protein
MGFKTSLSNNGESSTGSQTNQDQLNPNPVPPVSAAKKIEINIDEDGHIRLSIPELMGIGGAVAIGTLGNLYSAAATGEALAEYFASYSTQLNKTIAIFGLVGPGIVNGQIVEHQIHKLLSQIRKTFGARKENQTSEPKKKTTFIQYATTGLVTVVSISIGGLFFTLSFNELQKYLSSKEDMETWLLNFICAFFSIPPTLAELTEAFDGKDQLGRVPEIYKFIGKNLFNPAGFNPAAGDLPKNMTEVPTEEHDDDESFEMVDDEEDDEDVETIDDDSSEGSESDDSDTDSLDDVIIDWPKDEDDDEDFVLIDDELPLFHKDPLSDSTDSAENSELKKENAMLADFARQALVEFSQLNSEGFPLLGEMFNRFKTDPNFASLDDKSRFIYFLSAIKLGHFPQNNLPNSEELATAFYNEYNEILRKHADPKKVNNYNTNYRTQAFELTFANLLSSLSWTSLIVTEMLLGFAQVLGAHIDHDKPWYKQNWADPRVLVSILVCAGPAAFFNGLAWAEMEKQLRRKEYNIKPLEEQIHPDWTKYVASPLAFILGMGNSASFLSFEAAALLTVNPIARLVLGAAAYIGNSLFFWFKLDNILRQCLRYMITLEHDNNKFTVNQESFMTARRYLEATIETIEKSIAKKSSFNQEMMAELMQKHNDEKSNPTFKALVTAWKNKQEELRGTPSQVGLENDHTPPKAGILKAV